MTLFSSRNSITDDQEVDPSGKIGNAIIRVGQYLNKRVQIFADA